MRNKKLLIIDKHQFGTLTDSFKWCEYLKDDFDIKIVTPRGNGKVVHMDGVRVICVPGLNRLVFGIRFMIRCFFEILFARGAIMVVYFEKSDLLKRLIPWKKMILDIRTLSVDADERIRLVYNKKIIQTCHLFDHVTCISKGLLNQIGIVDNKCSILPLGADSLCLEEKDYSDLRLLYVGTLTGRNINHTIEGVRLFNEKYPGVALKYEIVGDGWSNELDELRLLVSDIGLENDIVFHGRVPYTQLPEFFIRCNVGVSYIPMTEYFEYQPPTKTFEYILSGLVCVATSTFANKEIVNDNNGVLIVDTPESFAFGLEVIYNKRNSYKTTQIAATAQYYKWSSIVQRDLYPVLLRFVNSRRKCLGRHCQ